MIKLDKNGLVVNNISKTDGTDVFEAINSKMSLDEASENFLSLNGGTLSGNITFERFDTGNRSIGFKPSEGANAIFYTTTYESSDSNKGRFAIGSSDGTNMYWLTGDSAGELKWNSSKVITNSGLAELENNLYFIDSSTSRNVGYKGYEGAKIAFYSANHTNASDKGRFAIGAQGGENNTKYLIGKPDGTLTWNSSNIVTYSLLNNLKSSIYFNAEDSAVTSRVVGFTPQTDGARLALYNKNHETWTGVFSLVSTADGKTCALTGRPTGSLTWNDNQVITNYSISHIYFDHTAATSRDIGFSTSNNNTKRGAYMTFKSGSDASAAGHFIIQARDETNSTVLQGRPGGILTWDGAEIAPVGTIAAFAGSSVPPGWAYCGGAAVSRTTYAKLFSVIGTKYGTGDGSTTFNLPALQGRVLQGYTDSVTIGTKIASGLPDIQGSVNLSAGDTGSRLGLVRGSSGAFAVSKAAQTNPNSVGKLSGVYEEFTFKASSYNSTYGKTTGAVQPSALAVMFVIKYK